jgi:hypothetical protein
MNSTHRARLASSKSPFSANGVTGIAKTPRNRSTSTFDPLKMLPASIH